MIQPTHYLLLGVLLFTIGMVTTVARRHPMIVLLGIELMLQAVNVVLVALASWFQDWSGEIAVFVVLAIAALELAVGLGVALAYGQQHPSWPHSEAK
jgi:NADH-quinone oxidoreductase subunit K